MQHTNITVQEIRLLAVLTLIAGIVFDYLFYGKAIGVSYPLFLIVFLLPLLGCFTKTDLIPN